MVTVHLALVSAVTFCKYMQHKWASEFFFLNYDSIFKGDYLEQDIPRVYLPAQYSQVL